MNTHIPSGLTAEPTQGWAHKALFAGIIAAVGLVVGLGLFLYVGLQPVAVTKNAASSAIPQN